MTCDCRSRVGMWARVRVHPDQDMIARAIAENGEQTGLWRRDDPLHLRDASFDRAKADSHLGRLAEYVVASVLDMDVSPIQKGDMVVRRPDLTRAGKAPVGVRWSSTEWLMFRHGPTPECSTKGRVGRHGQHECPGPRKSKLDPPDEPEVLVTGDEREMTIHGWMMFGEIDRDADYQPQWSTWAVHRDHLHFLPIHKPL